ncbi:MAG: HAD-IA family hydrolase, partial [Chloroflexi bacterium]|nr:HAD-IA family hydrolase [Chloroflexota bacterium]
MTGRSSPELAGRLAAIQLIVFDKDGTLIDFHGMWGEWAIQLGRDLERETGRPIAGTLLERYGVDVRTKRTLAHGLLAATPMPRIREATVSIVEAAGVGSAEADRAVAASWRAPDPVELAQPLADLPALLAGLRAGGPRGGRRIAIATTDDRTPTLRTVAALGLGALIDASVCADDGIPPKPGPDMVLHLCAQLGVGPGVTAVVGDAPSDLRMGRSAGAALVVGVLSGVGRRDEL